MANIIESSPSTPVVESPKSPSIEQAALDYAYPKVESPPPSARNVALKAMRSAVPAKSLSPNSVIVSFESGRAGPGAKKPGSKARICNDQYKVGLTVAQVQAACPAELSKYAYDCMLWDLRHGWLVVK